jgi:hypothetical protein
MGAGRSRRAGKLGELGELGELASKLGQAGDSENMGILVLATSLTGFLRFGRHLDRLYSSERRQKQ